VAVLSGQAQTVLIVLQAKTSGTTDSFRLDQIDRALDEIIRLNSTNPAAFQVRSAMANASKVLRDRERIAPRISLDDSRSLQYGAPDAQLAAIDLAAWLRDTRRLNDGQRRVLIQIAEVDDASALAAEYGIAPDRMRERISRARQAARVAYAAEVVAA